MELGPSLTRCYSQHDFSSFFSSHFSSFFSSHFSSFLGAQHSLHMYVTSLYEMGNDSAQLVAIDQF